MYIAVPVVASFISIPHFSDGKRAKCNVPSSPHCSLHLPTMLILTAAAEDVHYT